ncbi:hypothetical protein [Corallococcus macrosporus]|uniref:NurA domain-containing protein n=1 Tax=Corallococcus macrosporus DSM 14697 TaxID=1189310 RepID=A0A250K0B9_9BACT|nr:hypothetical protein [Corallococcus macrosporus]ATB48806.1 hypothetical protein MYMAC_004437 [Corallococcus macrosporus DSM 14697]
MAGGFSFEGDAELGGDDDFRKAFNEELSTTLDIESWSRGLDLENVMERFRREIASAVDKEGRARSIIRDEVFPLLVNRLGGPRESGVYKTTPEELETLHNGLLFAGRVEAVHGITSTHESLPLGITQMGIAMVGYGGTSGTFSQRLFRKEMSERSANPVLDAVDFINRRTRRSAGPRKDLLSKLARRGIRTYAERAVLVDQSKAEWRIGHGNPCAYELLSGSGYRSVLLASLDVLRRLIKVQKKFVFVPSALEERGLLTLGHALGAGEYAIIETLERFGERVVGRWEYEGENARLAKAFVEDCCPDVVCGVYRASERTPPRGFYAHREHVHVAVRVAMADSILRPERGFPMLLDVAEASCRSAFGEDGFLGLVHDAYARAGANLEYFSEHIKSR